MFLLHFFYLIGSQRTNKHVFDVRTKKLTKLILFLTAGMDKFTS